MGIGGCWRLEGGYGMVRMMISQVWPNREYSQYIKGSAIFGF